MRRLLQSLILAVVSCFCLDPARSETPGLVQPRLSNMPLQPRIVGPAQPASNAQFGSVVAITYRLADGQQFMCTGTLLTTRLILTAGHCGCGLPNSYVVNLSQNAFSAGEGLAGKIDGAPILFDQRVCTAQQLGGGNDLALVRLSDDVALQPSQIADSSGELGYPPELVINLRLSLVKGMSLTAVGYGFTSSHSFGVRMLGQIPIFSFDCEEKAVSSFCAPFAEMILAESAGPRARTDTCGGDSGGPVFGMVNGQRRLIGVTSRAAPGTQDDPNLHCGGGGIYTLIGRKSVHQWLQANGVPELK
jgi:hypothetical protein